VSYTAKYKGNGEGVRVKKKYWRNTVFSEAKVIEELLELLVV